MKNNLINEFTEQDINKTTCSRCQCSQCKNENCEVPCRAHVPCDSPVTKCGNCR